MTATSPINDEENRAADAFLDFVNASPTPFHCVEKSIKELESAGFVRVSERDAQAWDELKPNGKYFFTRNESTLVAFAVGGQWKPGNGFCTIAAHTDSPNLRLKAKNHRENAGFLQAAVETYGAAHGKLGLIAI
eukprot:GABV01005030.1.p2 GENE.GABV01005030.1~~GABV01005030.1.p2  ORF type:complete len:134 (+),score=40.53 GABV01005030.1:19-420(+)